MLFLYKPNIIYVACMTYKQIGGSKQYVQPGVSGISIVLCCLKENSLTVQYMCSVFLHD